MPRLAYNRFLRTLLFFILYMVILFLQKDQSKMFKLWESLISLLPADNSNTNQAREPLIAVHVPPAFRPP